MENNFSFNSIDKATELAIKVNKAIEESIFAELKRLNIISENEDVFKPETIGNLVLNIEPSRYNEGIHSRFMTLSYNGKDILSFIEVLSFVGIESMESSSVNATLITLRLNEEEKWSWEKTSTIKI